MKKFLFILLSVAALLSPTRALALDILKTLGIKDTFQSLGSKLSGATYHEVDCDPYTTIDFPHQVGMKNVEIAKGLYEREKYCEAAQWFIAIGEAYDRMAPIAAEEASYYAILSLRALKDYDKSITAAKKYISRHQKNPERYEYALYSIGESFLLQMPSGPEQDQPEAEKAQRALRTYLNQYPEGKFADQARGQMKYAYNRLAEREMMVGRYYFRRGEYESAWHRFYTATWEYPGAESLPEGLAMLARTFNKLGVTEKTSHQFLKDFEGEEKPREVAVTVTLDQVMKTLLEVCPNSPWTLQTAELLKYPLPTTTQPLATVYSPETPEISKGKPKFLIQDPGPPPFDR
ncbi:outer membrane protein assembly factor BamD [bacterium]|nr:outer membrane protein assembly factor BamD [bacterium]